MRHIHPVGLQEKFVASGVYTYYRKAEPTGLIEIWNIYQLPDNAYLVRIDWDGRKDTAFQSSILLEAWYAPDKLGENLGRLEIYAYGAPFDPIKVVKSSYTFFDDFVQMSRKLDDLAPTIDEEVWSPDWVFLPTGTQLLTGFATARYALRADTVVKTFRNQHHFKDDTAFEGYFSQDIVRYIAEEQLIIANKTYSAYRYEWLSPDVELKPEEIVWFDERNVLLQHEIPWLDNKVILTQYARRPEPLLS
jgi:hypothetical protein